MPRWSDSPGPGAFPDQAVGSSVVKEADDGGDLGPWVVGLARRSLPGGVGKAAGAQGDMTALPRTMSGSVAQAEVRGREWRVPGGSVSTRRLCQHGQRGGARSLPDQLAADPRCWCLGSSTNGAADVRGPLVGRPSRTRMATGDETGWRARTRRGAVVGTQMVRPVRPARDEPRGALRSTDHLSRGLRGADRRPPLR